MALPITYNVRNLIVRWRVTLLAIGGIALVVTVLVVLLAMSAGFQIALRDTGRTDNAIITQKGSGSELSSGFSRQQADIIQVDSHVARDSKGQTLSSPEILIVANMPRKADGEPTNVSVRGVTMRAFEVRGGIEITQGRKFTPGLYEVIVGERIHERMRGLDIGDKVKMQRHDWQVVGVFRSQGGAFESEIWGDADVMAPAFHREGGYQTLVVRMKDPKSLPEFKNQIETNPQYQLTVAQERKYYEDQAGPTASALLGLALFVAVVMGTGAVFGAMNTMYAIVAARTREIGTLRALGFSRFSILFSFVVESIFLALIGGLIGCALALPMNGFTTATGGMNFSELAFAFKVTPYTLGMGLLFAVMMGIVGGLLPASRAARMGITTALREA